ncbi:MAG TPA: FtsX-like permease family protein [Streptosporangiaceae bacterium]|nr:FtsX-like permease family protein [Streptosporangiaceae bacterium]
MMYRLGIRLTLRSGREPFVRLLITAFAVAIGAAIMLAVLADFNAFKTTNNRPSWESTAGKAVSRNYGAATHSELWNYSNDIYRGQTIERLDVAGLGPHAPVPPGISRLPVSGQYYASPALAALIRKAPADELGDRFPGKLAGTIGQQALTGPDELVIYIGYAPSKLAALPATTLVSQIAVKPGKQVWTHYFRDAFIVGAIAFVFPILILIATATRLAAARREERYAALRLVGATSRQISIVSSVDAVLSAVLGAVLGLGIFLLLQPWLASTAITSQRYFADEVTPTTAGYLIVLIGVPVASAISSLLSLRRVRISPLGVARRVTPPAPPARKLAPLAIGVALFLIGLVLTNSRLLSPAVLLGLIVILIGLVAAGPWLTAQAAHLLSRFGAGASAVLAARRLEDNPAAAFRSVRGLVLAVFLGTVLAGLLPAVESLTATPSATALSNVLLAGFTAAPVCGNNVNCSGSPSSRINPLAGSTAQQRLIAQRGMPPKAAAALLSGLASIKGATAIPIYSESGPVPTGPTTEVVPGGRINIASIGPAGVISCAGLRELKVLGQCAPGRSAVVVQAAELFNDNPRFSTTPLANSASRAASPDVSGLYLQALLVKVSNSGTLEKVRTYLVTHATQSASGTAPRTFGEAVQARAGVADTIQRLIYIAVVLTIIVAGCSMAVSVGGSLVERKRPFTLLRVTGAATWTLYRVVFAEAVLPLAAATVAAGALGYLIAVLTVSKMAPAGTPVPVPGHAYFLTMGIGLVASLLVILASLPLLGRMTGPDKMRFE